MSMLNRALQVFVFLPALLFMIIGLRWLVAPAGVAPTFGLTLAEGVGLSSQVGDMAGFFLTLGSCMLIALITGRRSWYFPAIMLLSIAALGRIIAWMFHDATLAVNLIALEVIVATVLLTASRRLSDEL